MTGNQQTKRKIVVIGGGFAGLNFCMNLWKQRAFEITLIDRNNYNYFTPLLYQVATSFLEPSSISYPFRQLFRKKGIHFIMGEPVAVDHLQQCISLSDGRVIAYDELVIAAGAKTNFFGIESVALGALSIKGIDDALRMRNALLLTLEAASVATDPIEAELLLSIVVAGGGPTGVEIAGMLAEMKKNILRRDYPALREVKGDIYIIDGGEALLAPMSEKTHLGTYQALSELGVKIMLNSRVTDFSQNLVSLADGRRIPAGTLIWAAGITANVFEGIPAACLGPGKRLITDSFNQLSGVNHIWAIGDISIQLADPLYPKGHPQLAQVAMQQGRTLAANFIADLAGKKRKPFSYFDKGEMAIVGRHHAVVDLFKHHVHLSGFLALVIWLFIHVFSLVSTHNKIRTLYGWVLAYLLNDQSLRLIFRTEAENADRY